MAWAAAAVALLCLARPAEAMAAVAPPTVSATSYELMDEQSGAVLAAGNAEARMQPASLAKMMTFDLALRALVGGQASTGTMVPVGLDAWQPFQGQDVSRMWLLPNVPVSFGNLLLGLMVSSGNDAAVALADFLGGSQTAFVGEMNAEAQRLQMKNTHFVNAHGLQAPGQYSTAADMALLARHIWLTYPDFRQYTDPLSFTWDKITTRNYNYLIGADPRVFGLKSGYLSSVGYHLVATASQGGENLIAVVMGTSSLQASANQDQQLLNWGFAHFHDTPLSWKALVPARMTVWKGRAPTVGLMVQASPWVTLPGAAQGSAKPVVHVHLDEPLLAPVATGQQVGVVQVSYQGQVVAQVPVLAAGAVARGGLFRRAWDDLRLAIDRWLGRLHL